jgi:hypothetical protein
MPVEDWQGGVGPAGRPAGGGMGLPEGVAPAVVAAAVAGQAPRPAARWRPPAGRPARAGLRHVAPSPGLDRVKPDPDNHPGSRAPT